MVTLEASWGAADDDALTVDEAILSPIWHDKPETARRVRQRIGAVMKWAVAMQHRPDNPAGETLGEALGRQRVVVRHMPALPHGEVASAVAAVRAARKSIWTRPSGRSPAPA